jgi:ubiquinone/menaquinone biosynthesis C-methylase UbiE
MTNPAPPPDAGVLDVPAWERFCELVAGGGGVCDHPGRPGEPVPSSASFFRVEVHRVDHHRRSTLPFLMEHCRLAGRSVLEFGAGTGGLSVALALAGVGSVEAVEPVGLNAEAGRWRVRAYGLEQRIRFHHVPDTTRLPFGDGVFDAVLCSSVLQYVPDPGCRRALLAEMARVTRTGGLVVLSGTGNGLYPAGPHSSRWWSNLFPGVAARRGHNRGVSYWEVRRALAPLGFQVFAQGRAALKRWGQRMAGRSQKGPRRWAASALLTSLGIAVACLGPLTGAPHEAFLPYPELAFAKRDGTAAGAETGRTRTGNSEG